MAGRLYVQQNGVETLHQHRATLRQETGLSSFPWDLRNPTTNERHKLTGWRAENAQSLDRFWFEDAATFRVFFFFAGSGELCRCIGLMGGSIDVRLG